MNILDITGFRQRGKNLIARIELAVDDTQLFETRELPNMLRLTQKQYDNLIKQDKFDKNYDVKEQIYGTDKNVMEVEIV